METLTTWQFNLIGFYIFVVVFFQFYKLAVRNAKHDGAATILLQSLGGLSILALLPLFPITFPSNPVTYVLLAFACIFYALSDRLNTTARKHLEVSTFSILNQLSTVFLILFGFTFFREPLSISKILGAGLILGGNTLLMYKKGQLQPNKFTWLAIMATVMFATAISIDIGISKQFNLPFYIMSTLIVPAFLTMLAEKVPFNDVLEEFKSPDQRFYIITGVAWGLAILFSLRAFQFGQMTTIVPLQALPVLLNVGVAYLFLHERTDELKKIVAALLVVAGVYLTVL